MLDRTSVLAVRQQDCYRRVMRIGSAARLALLAVLLVPGVAPAKPTRPNVVLVITDARTGTRCCEVKVRVPRPG